MVITGLSKRQGSGGFVNPEPEAGLAPSDLGADGRATAAGVEAGGEAPVAAGAKEASAAPTGATGTGRAPSGLGTGGGATAAGANAGGAASPEKAGGGAGGVVKKPRVKTDLYKFDAPFPFSFAATDSTLSSFLWVSGEPNNKKIPKFFRLKNYMEGVLKQIPANGCLSAQQFPFALHAKSLVVDKGVDTVDVLSNLVKEKFPKLKCVFGYAPLEKPGQIKSLTATGQWAVEMASHETVTLLRNLDKCFQVRPAWILEYNTEDLTLHPRGISVVVGTQILLQAMEEKAVV